MDKELTKLFMRSVGVPVLPCAAVDRNTYVRRGEAALAEAESLGFPLIVKPGGHPRKKRAQKRGGRSLPLRRKADFRAVSRRQARRKLRGVFKKGRNRCFRAGNGVFGRRVRV